MNSEEIQKKIDEVFKKCFKYTPLTERLKDIDNENFELQKWLDVPNLHEEAGDLLCSIIELHTENGWKIDESIERTLNKILRRADQYKTLGRKVKVAILGGAFNTITNGHIQSAQFVLNTSGEFDEVWLMPAYHHMYNKPMESAEHRLMMCKIAANRDGRIKVFDYEIQKQLKGETYYFFKSLKDDPELTEQYNFSMIIGQDNANSFDKWVNYEELERMTRFVVIPRKGYSPDPKVTWYLKPPHIYLNDENHIIESSSTDVRALLKTQYPSKETPAMRPGAVQPINQLDQKLAGNLEKRLLLQLIDENVYKYIIENNLYRE